MSVAQTLITVCATLAGTITGTVLGSVLKKRADSEGRAHEWHVKLLEYSAQLVSAFSLHRKAMWDLEAARLRGDQDEIDTALAASETTRAAIDLPQLHVMLLAPQLKPRILQTARTIYAMDTATDPASRTDERLKQRRAAAKAAIGDLMDAMATLMRKVGAGLPEDTRPARRRTRAIVKTARERSTAISRDPAAAEPADEASSAAANQASARSTTPVHDKEIRT